MTEIPTPTADDPADTPVAVDPATDLSSSLDSSAISAAEQPSDETAAPATPDEAPSGDDARSARIRRRRRMNNPVVWREMHTRFDSLGTAAIIVIFLALLGLPAVVVYSAMLADEYALLELGRNGVTLFETTLLIMLGLVMLIAPLQAAGSIAVERDRQTLMPMQISLLRPWQIALGKIRVATTFSMYLLVLGAPILAIAWSVGSVSVGHLALGLVLLLVTIVFTTTVTVLCSSFTRRSIVAVFMAYIALGVMIGGPSIGFVVWHRVDAMRGDDPVKAPKVLLATNPVMALATAVGRANPSIEEEFFFDPLNDVVIFEGPLSSLKNSLITEQDGVLGIGQGEMIDGPMVVEESVVVANGAAFGTVATTEPILTDPIGLPILDENGTPIPDDGTYEVSVSEDGEIAVIDSDGNPVPLLDQSGSDETAISNMPVGTIPPLDAAGADPPVRDLGGIPLWLEYIAFVALVSGVAAWGTTRRLRTPAATER